ncbi:hypothetical protein J6590_048439 [Homalodisca vitripennis]|nr:hypothetical protein J6590_048439 [Homalodisca vitripennis]
MDEPSIKSSRSHLVSAPDQRLDENGLTKDDTLEERKEGYSISMALGSGHFVSDMGMSSRG